jgi:hypothetical protein
MPSLDPAPGCAKNFAYEYECYAPGRPIGESGGTIPPEAAGQTVALFCSCDGAGGT